LLRGVIQLGLSLPWVVSAEILRVPADHPTLQGAISAARDGDLIRVSPGTYFERISFEGKAITVASTDGPAVTILDAGGSGTLVRFDRAEGPGSVLQGFTLQNAFESFGAAVTMLGSSPKILGNVFQDNHQSAGGFGAGIGGNGASPIIVGNLFRRNTADDQWLSGVVSFVNSSSPLIANNLFVSNDCRAINISVTEGNRPRVMNNTVIANRVGIRIDARVPFGSHAYLNNLLFGNDLGLQVDFLFSSFPAVWRNNLVAGGKEAYRGVDSQAGLNGNLALEPFFVCPPTGDFRLLATSPGIDAGENSTELPATDLAGGPRVLPSPTVDGGKVDLGAYEWDRSNSPTPCVYVNCAGDVEVIAVSGESEAVVTYPPPEGQRVAVLSQFPPSGSRFPEGTHTVTNRATYGREIAECTFRVTVRTAPRVSTSPVTLTAAAGETVNLLVEASGSRPFTYQWFRDGAFLAGVNQSTLSLTNAQHRDDGLYTVRVENGVGVAAALVARVRVVPSAPVLTLNPESAQLTAGADHSLKTAARGTEPLAFRWLFQGQPVKSAETSELRLVDVQEANGGEYRVVVSNALGAVTSRVAVVSVGAGKPVFTIQPAAVVAGVGSGVQFSVRARGSATIRYQWQHAGTNLAGATAESLRIPEVREEDAGDYRAVAINGVGEAASDPARLQVYRPPSFARQLRHQVLTEGSSAILEVEAVGTPPLQYRWLLNGRPLENAGPRLVLDRLQANHAGYYSVTVSSPFGEAVSECRVSVLPPGAPVRAWGDNAGGQTSVPEGLMSVGIAAGDFHSLALLPDGGIAGWGDNSEGQRSAPVGSLRWVALAAGADHSLGLLEDGTVMAWGRGREGQCAVPPGLSRVLTIAAGEDFSLAVLATGRVVAWGDDTFRQVTGAAQISGIRAVAAGRGHGLALGQDGRVSAWGWNHVGQASPPPGQGLFQAVAAGHLHSVALGVDGRVTAWGDNTYGQINVPAGLTNVVRIEAGAFHTLALTGEGRVVVWGDGTLGQRPVPEDLGKVTAVAAGHYHALALVDRLGRLNVRLEPTGLVLWWDGRGTLQSAAFPEGPYRDVPTTGSSYSEPGFTESAKFYRLRE
jgi:hypothetical protein